MRMQEDRKQLDALLGLALEAAAAFLHDLDHRPAGRPPAPAPPTPSLPHEGLGAARALALLRERYEGGLSGSAGPRYFGFVTGGVTPAALMGDWLTAAYDQNVLGSNESIAPRLELDALTLLRQLLGLSPEHHGSFVTGATMANFVGLAVARQWVGLHHGRHIDRDGLHGLPPVPILSGEPHSSVFKALSMLGMGRESLSRVPCLPHREAVDLGVLEQRLAALAGRPAIVVANAGTVNTVDFDDLEAMAGLRDRYPFWLHVDGAFGAFAACVPEFRHLVNGLDAADSVTVDAHKWLNVPYDSAMQFCRHPDLQSQVFRNAAAYLDEEIHAGNFVHRTPENSRRLRALPAWMTLMAYGRHGAEQVVRTCSAHARWLAARMEEHPALRLLAPVRLNGICFTLQDVRGPEDGPRMDAYLDRLRNDGTLFLTPTVYRDLPAGRLSFSNWRTGREDVARGWEAMQRGLEVGSHN